MSANYEEQNRQWMLAQRPANKLDIENLLKRIAKLEAQLKESK